MVQQSNLQPIKIENLLLSLENPRLGPTDSQLDALRKLVQSQGRKLVNLASHIVKNGLDPTDVIMVVETETPGRFTVEEGNRRVAVLKLLINPDLLDNLELSRPMTKRYKELQVEANGTIPLEIYCAVVETEDASLWKVLKHTGENDGTGVVPWNTTARARHRKASPEIHAVEMVEKEGYLTPEMKAALPDISLSNVQRMFVGPDAMKLIGVGWENQQLTFDSDDAKGRLALIVRDVLTNTIDVTNLRSKEDRVSYAKSLLSRPLPDTSNQSGTAKSTQKQSGSGAKRTATKRTKLVPKGQGLSISQTRISSIYQELGELNVTTFTNAVAVLIRVFIEMSVDDYAARMRISLKDTSRGVDYVLRKKLTTVATYMEQNKLRTKSQLFGIRATASQKGNVLSVDSWHAYVHNKDYSPAPGDLISNWDSVQSFIEEIWRA